MDNQEMANRFNMVARHKKLLLMIVGAVALVVFVGYRLFPKKAQTTYQTAIVEKGTLISSISSSGTITSGNYVSLTTKVSGVVSKVFVTNGDIVTKGQKIAEVTLDDYAKERQTAAWVSYLDATVAVKESINGKALADVSMWKARQVVLDAQDALDDMNDNDTNPATNAVYTAGERMIITKTLDQTRKAFTVAESKYLNSDAGISNAGAQVAAALRIYQENSAIIVAPSAGVISDLSLAPGLLVNASSTTSSTSGATIVSAQTVGKISNPKGQLIASVNLTEIDIIKVKANQKVTLTLDAYPGKTFTGKVLSVNTSGGVSSGVTSYPVTILLDPVTVDIYPNMAVSVNIIVDFKDEVLFVPSGAVKTAADGTSTAQILVDGKPQTVEVTIGIISNTETEIVSGLSEGQEVVTGTVSQQTTTSGSQSSSPFGGVIRTGSFGGGAARGR